jgi:hypothetical protein
MCTEYADYAGAVLKEFIFHFSELYGRKWVSYNVHGLVHLADIVKEYGPLDEVSSFVFENFLGTLKKMVRSPVLPLQQVVKRLSEEKSAVKAHVARSAQDVFQKASYD